MCDIPSHFADAQLIVSEVDLYSPFISFIHSQFFLEHQPTYGNLRLVPEIIADAPASTRGMWTRPDIAAVAIRRHKYATAAALDVISFEVKTFHGCNLASVHEALAHKRFVTFSYLAWNRPACICSDRHHFETILSHCDAHGVGLITIHNPHDPRTYRVACRARRASISEDAIDEFVSTRLSDSAQKLVLSALGDLCRGPS